MNLEEAEIFIWLFVALWMKSNFEGQIVGIVRHQSIRNNNGIWGCDILKNTFNPNN